MSPAIIQIDPATLAAAHAMVDGLLKRGAVYAAEVKVDASGVVVATVPHAPVRQIAFNVTVSRDQ